MLINWPEKRSSAEHPLLHRGRWNAFCSSWSGCGNDYSLWCYFAGTANAFATALGIPTTIEAACQTILDGKTRVVDAAYCNGKPIFYLQELGLRRKRLSEPTERRTVLACWLVLAGIQALRNLPSFEARVETEDKIVTLRLQRSQLPMPLPNFNPGSGPAELLVDDGLLDVTSLLLAP